MPIPNWLKVDPSGKQNGTKNVTFSSINPDTGAAAHHTGRVARSEILSVQNPNVENCQITVQQAGASEFVNIQGTASSDNNGGNITITGKSNSKKLTFAWKTSPTPEFDAPIPASYTAAGISTANGANIENDPGADAEYNFRVVLNVPENETAAVRKAVLVVTDDGDNTAQCEITQAAGDPYLWVGSEGQTEITVQLNADGTPVSVQILSNTAWEIV